MRDSRSRYQQGTYDVPHSLPPARFFPPVELADTDGLVGFGGELTPEWLLDAYGHGIFPWPHRDDHPIPWWSPDPRAILELDRVHVSRRLRRTCRSGKFRATCDQHFGGVIRGCAAAPGRKGRTWITPAMVRAYTQLHELGHVHSIEVWKDDALAGGIYGVAIGGLFSAESKFYRERDASKVGLVTLVAHLRARGYSLLDIQQLTPHMISFGAIEIPRADYMARLAKSLADRVTFGKCLDADPATVWQEG